MHSKYDRESLRTELHTLTDHQRRIALERAVEHLPDRTLESLLFQLANFDRHLAPRHGTATTLESRVDAHIASTRRREHLGESIRRNAHGQREPWQTAVWLAATSHLFDVCLQQAASAPDPVSIHCVRSLLALVAEVDERVDELVTFEDSSAHDELSHEVQRSLELLRSHAAPHPAP